MEIIEKIIVQQTEPAILRNTAWLEPISKKLFVYLNGKWELVTEEAEVAELWEAINKLQTSKANTSGEYEELIVGNLLGRSTDALVQEGVAFKYRTTAGGDSINEAPAQVQLISGSINAAGEPFVASELKSIGFNHYNPINNVSFINGYKLVFTEGNPVLNTTATIVADANSAIGIARVVNTTGVNAATAGYEIVVKEGSNVQAAFSTTTAGNDVVSSTTYPNLNDLTTVYTTTLRKQVARNSTCYSPSLDGFLVFNLKKVVSGSAVAMTVNDAKDVCVHLCWSGYNDGKYEAYKESPVAEDGTKKVPIPMGAIHTDGGLYATGVTSPNTTIVRDYLEYTDAGIIPHELVRKQTIKTEIISGVTYYGWEEREDLRVTATVLYSDDLCATASDYTIYNTPAPTTSLLAARKSGDTNSTTFTKDTSYDGTNYKWDTSLESVVVTEVEGQTGQYTCTTTKAGDLVLSVTASTSGNITIGEVTKSLIVGDNTVIFTGLTAGTYTITTTATITTITAIVRTTIYTKVAVPVAAKYVYLTHRPMSGIKPNTTCFTVFWGTGNELFTGIAVNETGRLLFESATSKTVSSRENDFVYFELQTPHVHTLIPYGTGEGNKYSVWDFGCEYFLNMSSDKTLLVAPVEASGVKLVYKYYMRDGLRNLLQRDLQDKTPINYVVELTTAPTSYSYTGNMKYFNTVFHYYDSVNTHDYWYVGNNATNNTSNSFSEIDGMVANTHYIWVNPIASGLLILKFAPIYNDYHVFRNEYTFEFRVGSDLAADPTISFPVSINGTPIMWNSLPDIKKPTAPASGTAYTVYEFSIDPGNGIGLWAAGNEASE